MTCAECGREFLTDPEEPWGEERDVCYTCEREIVGEIAPELLDEGD